jgi:hypothetical protein
MTSKKISNTANRGHTLTIFNYEEKDMEATTWEILPYFRYVILAEEICPKSNRPHLQGYIEFTRPLRRTAVSKLFTEANIAIATKTNKDGDDTVYCHAHIEPRMGTREQARDYCRGLEKGLPKPSYISHVEFGNWDAGGQGARTDLISIYKDIQSGTLNTVAKIMDRNPGAWLRYRHSFSEMLNTFTKKQNKSFRKVEVVVFVGKGGTGKSGIWNKFSTHYDEDLFTCDAGETFPFDGYNMEKTVIIDDYRSGFKYDKMLRLLDGHPIQLNVKGSYRHACYERVFITSNKDPENWYPNKSDIYEHTLKRRFSKIYKYDEATHSFKLEWENFAKYDTSIIDEFDVTTLFTNIKVPEVAVENLNIPIEIPNIIFDDIDVVTDELDQVRESEQAPILLCNEVGGSTIASDSPTTTIVEKPAKGLTKFTLKGEDNILEEKDCWDDDIIIITKNPKIQKKCPKHKKHRKY